MLWLVCYIVAVASASAAVVVIVCFFMRAGVWRKKRKRNWESIYFDFESLLGRLGRFLGPPWHILAARPRQLGTNLVHLGTSSYDVGASCADRGASWRLLGRSWHHLGRQPAVKEPERPQELFQTP